MNKAINRAINKETAFSMIEILLAVIFISFAFLPIYNLLRFGEIGTTSNINEVTATCYASDLINFVREIPFPLIKQVASNCPVSFKGDAQIQSAFSKISIEPPPATDPYFERSITFEEYQGKSSTLLGKFDDWFHKRVAVPNFIVRVKVEYPRIPNGPLDNVILFSVLLEK